MTRYPPAPAQVFIDGKPLPDARVVAERLRRGAVLQRRHGPFALGGSVEIVTPGPPLVAPNARGQWECSHCGARRFGEHWCVIPDPDKPCPGCGVRPEACR